MVKVCLIFAGILALTIASLAQAEEPSNATATSAPEAKAESHENKPEKKHSEKKADKKKASKESKEKLEKSAKSEALPKDVKKLIVQDTLQGTGKIAFRGKTIKVNYTGWLYDPSASMGRGKQFDSSVGKEPFSFKLGAGEVIKGWDEGFSDMKVGGKRKLIVPAELGYGDRGAGNVIPPNSSLMFEVELIDVM
jgi:FKBP-type peptidyl-prolyl cis-trans isomerase FkpA